MRSTREKQSPRDPASPSLSMAAKQIARYPHPSYWFASDSQRRNRISFGFGLIAIFVLGALLLTWFGDHSLRNSLLPAFVVPTFTAGLILILPAWNFSVFIWIDRCASYVTYHLGRLMTALAVGVMTVEALAAIAWAQLSQAGQLQWDAEGVSILQAAVAAVGLLTVVMAFAGSVVTGSFIDARWDQTSYLRRRYAGRVLLCSIAVAGIHAAALTVTVLPPQDRAIPMSLILAVFLPLLRWQSQRIAQNDSTKDHLRTCARNACETMQTWASESAKRSERIRPAKESALSALGVFADALKAGNIAPAGTRQADSGTLIVIDYLREALPEITQMRAKLVKSQGARYPEPLEPFHDMRPSELRTAALQYLRELYERLEDARHIQYRQTPAKTQRRWLLRRG
ncbi:hypothetical protein [Arthrobacter sp. RCC_34]|uniref:hypothetical protein n=1 Tax=Arthrobacter sp. RCC_34 TaxID=3239230 RepID=UPI003524AA1A